MFLVAPTGNGLPLRVAPVASVLLVLLNVLAAAWVLPTADRMHWERQLARHELSEPRLEKAAVLGTAGRPLDSARRQALAARITAIDARDPFQLWGYRLGAPPWRTLSALFVHADALHLVANLLFLALVGAYLEQAWGPAGVLALFLGGGALALHLDACAAPQSLVVGASGGIAALLGAYSIRFRRQPLRCRYVHLVFLRPRGGTFQVPGMTLAGLWLLQQIVGAWLASRAGDQSIAFVSHLVGFGTGVLAASVLELAGLGIPKAGRPLYDPGHGH